jgi:hypothetical protein
VRGQRPLEFVAEADAVLIGSGIRTRDVVATTGCWRRWRSTRAAADRLAVLGRAGAGPARPGGRDAGVHRHHEPPVREERGGVLDAPFHAEGRSRRPGAAWRRSTSRRGRCAAPAGEAAAEAAVHYVGPGREEEATVERVMAVVTASARCRA